MRGSRDPPQRFQLGAARFRGRCGWTCPARRRSPPRCSTSCRDSGRPTALRGYGTAVLDRMAAKNQLRGLDRETFVDELTKVWARINYVHPFREGNTPGTVRILHLTQRGRRLHVRHRTIPTRRSEPSPREFVGGRFPGAVRVGDDSSTCKPERPLWCAKRSMRPSRAPRQRTIAEADSGGPSYGPSALAATSGHPRPIGKMLANQAETDVNPTGLVQRELARDSGYER